MTHFAREESGLLASIRAAVNEAYGSSPVKKEVDSFGRKIREHEDGTQTWDAEEQPFDNDGVHVFYRSHPDGHVATVARDKESGKEFGWSSHPSGTHDAVRKHLANKDRSK